MRAPPAFISRFQIRAVNSAGVSALAAALFCAFPVFAAPPMEVGAEAESSSWSWGLGIGAMSKQKAYAGYDRENKVVPIPMVRFENQYVRVSGPGVEVKLPTVRINEAHKLKFAIVGRYDFSSGYEADDSPRLAGMSERKGSFWAGAKVAWENDLANVTAEWAGDASGHSKGQLLSLGIDRTWRFGNHVMLTPRLSATWQDSKYVDYYYGVRNEEARVGRAVYHGDGGMSARLGVRGVYRFDRHHSVLLDVGVTSLASEIKNSPLVDRSTENSVFFSYGYRFR